MELRRSYYCCGPMGKSMERKKKKKEWEQSEITAKGKKTKHISPMSLGNATSQALLEKFFY